VVVWPSWSNLDLLVDHGVSVRSWFLKKSIILAGVDTITRNRFMTRRLAAKGTPALNRRLWDRHCLTDFQSQRPEIPKMTRPAIEFFDETAL